MKKNIYTLLLCIYLASTVTALGDLEESGADNLYTPGPSPRSEDRPETEPNTAPGQSSVTDSPAGEERDGATGTPKIDSAKQPKPPDPISTAEFTSRILKEEPLQPAPVLLHGKPLSFFIDLDVDGYAEGCVLAIDEIEEKNRTFAALSDFSRMLETASEQPTFSLVIYRQENNAIHRYKEIELGRYPVLESYDTLPIVVDAALPVCVYASFQMQEGLQSEWVIFRDANRYSRFSLRESAAISTIIDDIDDDQTMDILIFERVLEEGTGYETLVSWYWWDGTDFIRKGTTNIVRNLKAFLATVKGMILSGDWEAFTKFALDPEALRNSSYADLEPIQLAGLPFSIRIKGTEREHPQPDSSEMATLSQPHSLREGSNIIAVAFPEFYENPFTRLENGRYAFPIRIKLVFADRDELLLQSVIIMRKNPFDGGQFYFQIPPHTAH